MASDPHWGKKNQNQKQNQPKQNKPEKNSLLVENFCGLFPTEAEEIIILPVILLPAQKERKSWRRKRKRKKSIF